MIGAIIQAADGVHSAVEDQLMQQAVNKAGTNADGTVNMAAYDKNMKGLAIATAITRPDKLIGQWAKRRAMLAEAKRQRQAYNNNTMETATGNQETGLKDGGKVKSGSQKTSKMKGGELVGKGGPKDDAIPATLNKGDVVIPADADQQIVSYIMEKLGLNKQVDEAGAVAGDGADVNLSNGETIIPAAYVKQAEAIASELGMSLNDLMPNATDTEPEHGGEYALGLLSNVKIFANSGDKNDLGTSRSITGKGFSGALKSTIASASNKPRGIQPSKGVATSGSGKVGKFLSENSGTILGAAQAVTGAAMAAKAGGRPDADTSGQIAALANRVAEKRRSNIATFKDSSQEAIEQKRRMGIDNAVRIAPGASSAMASAQEANSQAASDRNEINKQVATLSNDGLEQDANLEARGIEMQQKVLEDKQKVYDKKMEGAAKLVGTGMQNVIDSLEYKKNRKSLEIRNKLRNIDPLLNSTKKD